MLSSKLVSKLRFTQVLDLSSAALSSVLHAPLHSAFNLQPKRQYAFKSDLKIKWVRPTKIASIKPIKSGDLKPIPTLDSKLVYPEFANTSAIKDVSEEQKKLYTLEFLPSYLTKIIIKKDVVSKVQRHDLDLGSIEAKIAKMTVTIRNTQKHMEEHPRNIRRKVKLKELIEKRKKYLKYLRRWDYKKFEWLLEKLDIFYRPPPEEFYHVTRKDSLRKLTQEHCDNIRSTKLEEYKKKLDAQKAAFEKEKAEILAWIAEEERACGVTSSEPSEQKGGSS